MLVTRLVKKNEETDPMSIDLEALDLNELKALAARAQKLAEVKQRSHQDDLRRRLIALAKDEGYDAYELFGDDDAPKKVRRPARPKYRNPDDHAQTWTGRGKNPNWVKAVLARGLTLQDLLIPA
jgi:DNA-binding protein H-NS